MRDKWSLDDVSKSIDSFWRKLNVNAALNEDREDSRVSSCPTHTVTFFECVAQNRHRYRLSKCGVGGRNSKIVLYWLVASSSSKSSKLSLNLVFKMPTAITVTVNKNSFFVPWEIRDFGVKPPTLGATIYSHPEIECFTGILGCFDKLSVKATNMLTLYNIGYLRIYY